MAVWCVAVWRVRCVVRDCLVRNCLVRGCVVSKVCGVVALTGIRHLSACVKHLRALACTHVLKNELSWSLQNHVRQHKH